MKNIKLNTFKHLKIENFYTLFGLIILCLIMAFLKPVFLSINNILNVFLQASINGLLAVGVTFVIISAGIDLSCGAILALAGVITAIALMANIPLVFGIIIGVLIGGIVGLVNGVIITKFNVPAFIATLGTMSIARGLALLSTGGESIYGFKENFKFIGQGYLFKIPFPVVVLIVVAAIGYFMLNYTRLGRYAYAIGGNIEAVKLSGISTELYITLGYVISGITAGIAGIIMASELDSAQAISGTGYELQAIAAAVIGGTSLSGGKGSITGTIIGALIISVIGNGMNLLNVTPFLQQIIIGCVIILAVFIDSVNKKEN